MPRILIFTISSDLFHIQGCWVYPNNKPRTLKWSANVLWQSRLPLLVNGGWSRRQHPKHLWTERLVLLTPHIATAATYCLSSSGLEFGLFGVSLWSSSCITDQPSQVFTYQPTKVHLLENFSSFIFLLKCSKTKCGTYAKSPEVVKFVSHQKDSKQCCDVTNLCGTHCFIVWHTL